MALTDDDTNRGLQSCWVSQRLVTGRDRWLLLICSDNDITTCELPNGQEVTIGRGDENHVRIDHSSVSEVHVRLTLGEKTLLADEGSTNGTRLGGKRLEPHVPVRLRSGEPFEVGALTLVLQRLAKLAPRNVLTHDYFEARLDEECAKRCRRGGPFGVVRVYAGRSADKELVEAALHRALRSQDVIALYAPGEYEILLDVGGPEMDQITARLEAAFADNGMSVRVGGARYPADGATAGDLMARAHEAVHGAVPVQDSASTSELAGLDDLVVRVARSDLCVLILGETGAGKEVMAESVHRFSPRASKAFLRLNCAALSESLVESELFGHARGAFTGAVAAKVGLLESAQGGTVFLDEVGELSLSMQVKLLRVVEERSVTPVGDVRSRPIDVRFIAATNRDLEEEVARGGFREDLFYRLSGVTLVVPPLRERTGEIMRLARAFVSRAAGDRDRPVQISQAATQAMLEYSWPGNIRELRNVVERALLLADGDVLDLRHLPLRRMQATSAAAAPAELSFSRIPLRAPSEPAPSPVDLARTAEHGTLFHDDILSRTAEHRKSLHEDMRALERERIIGALQQCAGNQTKAARLLGISRSTLVTRLEPYGIPRPRK